MKYVLKESTAMRLAELVRDADQPDPPIPVQRKVTTWNPVLVRALDDTAVSGSDEGDQCYDAEVLLINSLESDQTTGAAVWLTVLNEKNFAGAPVIDQIYHGIYAGRFDPDPGGAGTDPRPRVFVAASDPYANAATLSTVGTTITPDNTWVDVDNQSYPFPPGRYLLMPTWAVQGSISATAPGNISLRIWDDFSGAAVDAMSLTGLVLNSTGVTDIRLTTITRLWSTSVTATLKLQAKRNAGPTWTSALILGNTAGTIFNFMKMSLG